MALVCGPSPTGSSQLALGLQRHESYSPAEATRIYKYINEQEHAKHGAAYQGAGADPVALGHDADLNADGTVSRTELLIGLLTKLVREAHLDESTAAYVAQL